MLTINDGLAERRLTRLEQFRVPSLGDGRRFDAQHGSEGERASAQFPLRHRHDPVGSENFVPATWAALLQGIKESHSVEHEHPLSTHSHEHRNRRRGRLDRGSMAVPHSGPLHFVLHPGHLVFLLHLLGWIRGFRRIRLRDLLSHSRMLVSRFLKSNRL